MRAPCGGSMGPVWLAWAHGMWGGGTRRDLRHAQPTRLPVMWTLPQQVGAIDGLGGRASSLHLSSCPLVPELRLHCALWWRTEVEDGQRLRLLGLETRRVAWGVGRVGKPSGSAHTVRTACQTRGVTKMKRSRISPEF